MKIYLKLVPSGYSNGVKVIVVDGNGDSLPLGNLLTFKGDGTVVLHPCVNKAFGFELANNDRLVVK